MSVLVLICNYDTHREICFAPCYHAISLSRMRSLFDSCMNRLDLLPAEAELYLSNASDHQLASAFANIGMDLRVTRPESFARDLGEMYEAKTGTPFARLQAVLRHYGRLACSFEKQDALQA